MSNRRGVAPTGGNATPSTNHEPLPSWGRLLVAGPLAAGRLALPVLVAARPLRGRSRGLLAAARLPRAAFLRLCGRRWVAFGSCPRRPRARSPAAARARRPPASARCARRCSPRLPPPALARLRAGPLAPPARPWSRALGGRSCPLRRVPPAARAGAGGWAARGGSPRGGSRPAARASGASFLAPARGVWRAAARRPAAAGKHPQGFPVLAGKKAHQSGKWCNHCSVSLRPLALYLK